MDVSETRLLSLWVCWWRSGAWVAKPFTGNESWADLQHDDYGEECVLVAAADSASASKAAEARPEMKFPQVLVAP